MNLWLGPAARLKAVCFSLAIALGNVSAAYSTASEEQTVVSAQRPEVWICAGNRINALLTPDTILAFLRRFTITRCRLGRAI